MITFGTEFDLVDTDYSASELWEIDEFARQQLDLEQVQAQPQTYSATSSPINLLSPDPDENPEVYGLNQQQQQQQPEQEQDGPIITEADQQRDQTTAPVVVVFPQPTDQAAVGPPSPSVAPALPSSPTPVSGETTSGQEVEDLTHHSGVEGSSDCRVPRVRRRRRFDP
ncbi:Hypothetical protein SMAX5B_017112, partial [Scophthalmus maximus]